MTSRKKTIQYIIITFSLLLSRRMMSLLQRKNAGSCRYNTVSLSYILFCNNVFLYSFKKKTGVIFDLSASAILAMTDSSLGLCVSNVFPDTESTNLLLMKSWVCFTRGNSDMSSLKQNKELNTRQKMLVTSWGATLLQLANR